MALVGIDFSLNSPAACIFVDGAYEFISFFNYPKDSFKSPIKKAFLIHDELMSTNRITGVMYKRDVANDDFREKELNKQKDASDIATLIDTTLKDKYDISDFAIEGFSYGSKGNSFIDMIMYNTYLRQKLISSYGLRSFYIFQPSAVKKLAGKGNCDKLYMVNAFKSNVLKDPILEQNPFWQWIQDKTYDPKKISKPVDDIVDSYFIVKCLEAKLNSND